MIHGDPVIAWEDPPPSVPLAERGGGARRGPIWFPQVIGALKTRPGEWALIAVAPHQGYFGQYHKRLRADYGCEATTRAVRPGEARLYARYVNGTAS